MNNDIRNFTEDEIEAITSSYTTLIGKGGFGEVYKGVLDNDDLVAVKRYIQGDCIQEFMEELRIHSQINHKNIVKLIGYCRGENNLMIVTEYISNGNLEDILHNRKIAMPLDTRLGIAIGCAEALSYMHSMHLSTDSLVCHGDIKPANILLDENLTARLSDFGLSRLLSGGTTRHTMNVKGSIDYMDLIYLRNGCLTPKSDVYSFGIVLLELITRKRVKEGNISLIDTFSKAFVKGKVLSRDLFDDEIVNEGNLEVLETIGKLANKCLSLDIKNRPKMNVVAEELLELWKGLRRGQGLLKTSLGIFTVNFTKRTKLQNVKVKVFTTGELIRLTQNYSCLLSKSCIYELYKGNLEDNTLVAVVKYFFGPDSLESFIDIVKIMSQIVHKNIIALLGYCFQDNHPILVFDYDFASERRLTDILHGNKDHLPLELRLKIAVQTAQALVYIQSPSIGVDLNYHGLVMHPIIAPNIPFNILLDDNFVPKVTGYLPLLSVHTFKFEDRSNPEALDDIDSRHYMDPKSANSYVYSFGVFLMELISRKKPVYDYGCRLIDNFKSAYMIEKSGKALFDKELSAEDCISVLEEIGGLAIMCTREQVDERPTMEQVAECLGMLRRNWKKRRAKRAGAATSRSEAEAATSVGISGNEGTELDRPLEVD